MLERLRIVAFQAHDDLKIELDPHITTIVGPSDVGKSAVIRALRWLTTNKPSGDAFRRDGTDSTHVTLWVDGKRISRIRSEDENLYKLDGTDFKAFGGGVPDEITETLNLSDVNFQAQLDSPFWLTDSAGQIARNLNTIVDLEVIDHTMSTLSSGLRKARTLRDDAQTRHATSKKALESLAFVKGLDSELTDLEEAQELVQAGRIRVNALSSQVDEGIKLRETISTADAAATRGREVVEAGESLARSLNKIATLEALIRQAVDAQSDASIIVPDIKALDVDLRGIEAKHQELRLKADVLDARIKQIEQYKHTATSAVPDVEHLNQLLQKVVGLKSRVALLSDTIKRYNRIDSELDDCRVELTLAQEDFNRESDGVCPICHQPLTTNVL